MADPMHTYKEITELGPEAKHAADAFMQGLTTQYTEKNPAPPEVMEHGLQSILAKYTHAGRGLEKVIKWGGLLTAGLGFVTGLYPISVAGILASITPSAAKQFHYGSKFATQH